LVAPEPLPNALQNLLSGLPDREFAARFAQLHASATHAIASLAELDTSQFETVSDGLADLSVWEALAPVLGQTISHVNGFIDQARGLVPPDLEIVPGPVAEQVAQAVAVVQIGLVQLSQEIPKLGAAIRSPQVVSDRWALIAELQTFRARFRDLIGTLLFECAGSFGEITRRDVVPGFGVQLKNAISLRATSADLGRLVVARRQKLDTAEPEDLQWHAVQMDKELQGFASTSAYRSLRAQDKHRIVEIRSKLAELAQQPAPEKMELVGVAVALDAWVHSLADVNRRQILIDHDREIWAAIGVRLERIEMSLRNPAEAGKLFSEAVAMGQSLYGREAGLDGFLRRAKKTPIAALPAPELSAAFAQFRELIANLSVFG
jgi:hypothetical protein